ncbi:mitochondrial fission regulator 2 isoform X1 [Chelonia mydas]|uniref:mitochondrial fission regulator 2 isoform X1 n=1 Tax=Chelonia mydas TaxID=8469 RepID=UPI0018A239F7|nr:mitochondrial fission regulator 2 isoform X1 [Chelonia mydas]XP_027676355.2 mitochondrial fission regulator 2 isoform X1 [Chelonia mydas]XP_027676356.2 mitochondrial fission regulator 2 isoform X1 [Chelonia mydas]XP_037750771.1 mitochondrial fission regulator 2 isoform X1 [Chelonia mydas]XP_043398913.1 mitochondrial fission regulator 2 isoform X1 [Chelonia mydas]
MALLLNLIRQLLEYFGVPADQFITRWEAHIDHSSIGRMIETCLPSTPFSRRHFLQVYAVIRKCQVKIISAWQSKEYGSTRSIVRRLGTVLALEPCPRPHFQMVQDLNSLDYDEQITTPSSVVPSLGDILRVVNDEGETFARFRAESRGKEIITVDHDVSPAIVSLPTVVKSRAEKENLVNEEAIKKISALENELTLLRAQIAAIVAVQGSRNSSQSGSDVLNSFGIPSGSFPVPAMTSTPLFTAPDHFVIPPPPPLPSIAPCGFDASNSAVELIKQRRAASKTSSTTIDKGEHQKTKEVLSMMDVLKDINKIRLRTIEKSPGGTPLPKTRKRRSSQWDPAALIAQALKQKFAHQNGNDSLDKENRSCDTSPFSSPEAPLVGRPILKPNSKNNLIKAEEVTQVSTGKARVHI